MTITVFLADDHVVVRDGLRLMLEEQEDIHVIGDAANGRDAVHQVAQLCPDVVVMDIGMPELSGIEATRQIQQVCPSAQVVVLSMHDTVEHVFRALQAGARGYLVKESAGAEVIEAVRTVQAGHRYLSQKISDKVINDYMEYREAAEPKDLVACLTPRELDVLRLVVEGNSSAEVAALLSLSQKTVDTYRSRMMRKLSMRNVQELVRFAIQHGLTTVE
jgi:DNA-binding NarL/FixJ family response regulator